MAKTKTKIFYWLKFDKHFFENLFIKRLLRNFPGGSDMIVIYIRLMLEAIENDCVIDYEGTFDNYTEELALRLGVSEEQIKMTLAYFVKCGVIQVDSDGNTHYPQAKALLGQETNWNRYKKKQKLENFQPHSNYIPTEIEIEIEKEIEEKKDNSATSSPNQNLKYFFEKWQEITGRFPNSFEYEDIPKLHKEDGFSIELMLTALKEAASSTSNFNFNYFKSILMRYKRQGLLTPEMVAGAEKQRQEAKSKQYNQQPSKSNVPEWTEKDYKHEATAEEQAKLDELKKSLMED